MRYENADCPATGDETGDGATRSDSRGLGGYPKGSASQADEAVADELQSGREDAEAVDS